MIRAAILGLALAAAAPAFAEETATAALGEVRVLDKITTVVTDLRLATGESAVIGQLTVTMGECRYPVANPAGDAFVQLVIHDSRQTEPVFTGWMIASAPALMALDHPRYDVWALRCITDPAEATPAP